MTRKILYLLPFAIMILGSCLKTSSDVTVPIVVPTGTFTGQFRKIHLTKSTGKLDTAKSNFTLKMSTDSGYQVLADTTVLSAGSKGSFQLLNNVIYFIDTTFPKTGTPAKVHLSGSYNYTYDGSSVFQIAGLSADTLLYQYDLKKSR